MTPTSTTPALLFVDIETGGLRPKDRPWEIAAISRDLDGNEKQYVWHVLDFQPAKADPAALNMNGFYDRHPEHIVDSIERSRVIHGCDLPVNTTYRVLPEKVVAYEFSRLLRGTVAIGCNLPFYDAPKLEAMLNRHGLAWTSHYRPVCATTYAAGVLQGRGHSLPLPWVNGDIGELLGVSRDIGGTPHQGLADAAYARDLYDAANATIKVDA